MFENHQFDNYNKKSAKPTRAIQRCKAENNAGAINSWVERESEVREEKGWKGR